MHTWSLSLRYITSVIGLTLLATACTSTGKNDALVSGDNSYSGSAVQLNNVALPAQVNNGQLELGFGNRFEPRFWPGVNLGSTTPGHSPGELSPSRDDYDRWLRDMSLLGIRVVRIYTIQRPSFYDALKAFNTTNPSRPIQVIHGVWIPEEEFLETQNAYDTSVTEGFRNELSNAVAVAHGDINIPAQRGHASGKYTSDISPWLLAWSIGVEWDPYATQSTNEKNAFIQPFTGKYISATADANPMESWIASMMDHVATLETARGWSRPLTFTNWLTTDPLRHPDEPLNSEDLVSIDAMHISASNDWPAGMFASYHAYSYYPDFLARQPSYTSYKRPADGEVDPYAGYLHELKAHHKNQAVMITEFGIPTSIGSAHNAPLGRNQGGHSETDAAAHLASMMSVIKQEGYAGGVIFEWSDEWFKHTWNTVEYELPPDRRQYWRNPLTNEEYFGLLAIEPNKKPTVVLDGQPSEWKKNDSKTIAKNHSPIKELRVANDAEYLYLLINTENDGDLHGSTLAFDVRPGDNAAVIEQTNLLPNADVRIRFTANSKVILEQAAWTDPFSRQYGAIRNYVNVDAKTLEQNSGAWVPVRQLLSRPHAIPTSGERTPAETVTLDELRQGSTDTDSAQFDNRNLVYSDGMTTEMRIPWAYLTFADPSTHQVYAPHADGTVTKELVKGIDIALVTRTGDIVDGHTYNWDDWNIVDWHERKKQGWDSLQQMFDSAGRTHA